MKGERLQIKIKEVSQLAKGAIVTGFISSGRLNLNQTVYLHGTATGKAISCTIVNIRVNDRSVSQAKKNTNVTFNILGSHLSDYIIGQSYISSLPQPNKDRKKIITVKPEENSQFVIKENDDDYKIQSAKLSKELEQKKSTKRSLKKNNHDSIEKEITDCINHCLRDQGSISATEKFVIFKIAEAHNFPRSRCEQLFENITKSFNKQKAIKIFTDTVKCCLLDSNYLSESELFLLNRLHLSLNLDESTAHDIIYHYSWDYNE